MQYPSRPARYAALVVALTSLLVLGCGDGGGGSNPPSGVVAGCVMGGTDPLDTLGCPDPFVDAHNQWRQDVNAGNLAGQPVPMTPLPDVRWDPVLAEVAADYASRCIWEHNPDRTDDYIAIGGTQNYVGENLYASWGGTSTAAAALDSWGGEYAYYDHASNSCSPPPGKSCGHYTQVVWDDSVEIGCATVLCPEVEFDSGTQTNVWVTLCNYAPGGNFNGERPY